MGTITLTLPVAGTQITAGLHSTNYSTLQTEINGNIDNNNISATAGIAASKLALQNITQTLTFGSAGDTNLYRHSANILATDDTFRVRNGSNLQVEHGTTGITALNVHPNFFGAGLPGLILSNSSGVEQVRLGNDALDFGGAMRFYRSGTEAGIYSIAASRQLLAVNNAGLADGATAVYVARQLAGAVTLQQVSMGAVDSGGAGYRLLRVPN